MGVAFLITMIGQYGYNASKIVLYDDDVNVRGGHFALKFETG